MADINFNGINEQCVTLKMKSGAALKVGDFVSITNDGEAGAVAAKGDIVGKCVAVRNGFVTVQISGYMTATAASGETVTRGYGAFGVDTSGKLAAVTGARKILIIEYNSTTGKVGFIL